MANYNVRNGFKDIFGVYLLEQLSFEGDYDMPVVGSFEDISKINYLALYSDLQDYNKTDETCVVYYQYDHVADGAPACWCASHGASGGGRERDTPWKGAKGPCRGCVRGQRARDVHR